MVGKLNGPGALVMRSLTIVLCACVCAFVQSLTHQRAPAPSAQPTAPDLRTLLMPAASKAAIARIQVQQARQLADLGMALFIDARSDAEYGLGHLPGALPDVTREGPEAARRTLAPYSNRVLVVYCEGAECHLSDKAAETLFDWGFARVCVFFGGWQEWKAAGHPVEGRPG